MKAAVMSRNFEFRPQSPGRARGADGVNFFGRDGARELAETINAYWASYGYDARARAVSLPDTEFAWGIESDTRNGVPLHRQRAMEEA